MAGKDNANPIIHAQSVQPVLRREGKSGFGQDEWWRDASVHTKSIGLLNDLDDEYEDAEKSGDGEGEGEALDLIDNAEIFDLIRSISDPEHPLTLEQLAVVNASHVTVDEGDADEGRLPTVLLEFTPTIPHCSMATLIGLSLRVRLLRALPARYKVDIRVRPGTHQSENAVNKQLNDKERVAAALENAHLLDVVQTCLATARRRGRSEEEVAREVEEVAQRLGVAV